MLVIRHTSSIFFSAVVSCFWLASLEPTIATPSSKLKQEVRISDFRDNTPDEAMCEKIYEMGRILPGQFNEEDVPVLTYGWARGGCWYYKTSQGIQKIFLLTASRADRGYTMRFNGSPAKITGRFQGNLQGYEFIDSTGRKHRALTQSAN